MNVNLAEHNKGTRFSAVYQPGNKTGTKRVLEFKKYLRAEIKRDTIELLPEAAIKYLDENCDKPTVFDAMIANLISQALSADPRISFPAAKVILDRVFGKPVQVHKLEEEQVIEMEEVKSIDLSGFDRDRLKEYEAMTMEGIEAAQVVNETKEQ